MNWQCLLVHHDWGYWHMIRLVDSDHLQLFRVCHRCSKKQMQ